MNQASSAEASLATIRIVLVAPAGPLNVGSVARVMKNFGLSQLVLVTPQCDPLDDEALQMAVHAKDLLQAARRVETIPEALAGCDFAIATTARQRGFNAPLDLPEVALPKLITPDATRNTALIFGPEDRGLSNEELSYAQQFIKIPASPNYSALNLAQAVAVCCYELHRAWLMDAAGGEGIPSSQSANAQSTGAAALPSLLRSPLSDKQSESIRTGSTRTESTQRAQLDEIEGYYQHLERVLLQVGYLYPHTAASRMRKLRQLLHRAVPESNEVALLRGILRQVEWALSDSKKD